MDKLALLQTLRSEVSEPSTAQLQPAFERLRRSFNPERARSRAPRTRLVFAVVAGAAVVTLIAGNVHLSAQSAQAATVLRDAAGLSIQYSEITPGPGEYLLSRTHADWGVVDSDGGFRMNEQTLDVYVPYDANQEWVLVRDWGDTTPTGDGAIFAQNGEFYGDRWIQEDLNALPTNAEALLEYFDSQYLGGSSSRDEDNFVRMTGVLRSGLVPAELRAGFYGALALIPGVTSTADVANLDGVTGVAIGRTEPLRLGLRQEIIIDPSTGLVIGERQVATVAVLGFGVNSIYSQTAIETTVVSSAPQR
jgi:hypothetical protein